MAVAVVAATAAIAVVPVTRAALPAEGASRIIAWMIPVRIPVNKMEGDAAVVWPAGGGLLC